MQVAQLIKEDWPIVVRILSYFMSLKCWSVKLKNQICMHCYVFRSDESLFT